MKAWVVATALAGMLGCGVAIAASGGDGNELIKECIDAVRKMDGGEGNSLFDIGYCIGMTQGVRQNLVLLNEKLPPKYQTCFPASGITNGQGVRIVLKYLQDNPARLQEQASDLIFLVYHDAYPCK